MRGWELTSCEKTADVIEWMSRQRHVQRRFLNTGERIVVPRFVEGEWFDKENHQTVDPDERRSHPF